MGSAQSRQSNFSQPCIHDQIMSCFYSLNPRPSWFHALTHAQDETLDAISASTLPLLFPYLREPRPEGCLLGLIRCTVPHGDAVSTIAAQLHGLTELQLRETELKGGALEALARLGNLTRLEMCYQEPGFEGGVLTMAPLRSLNRLQSLSLRGLGVCADGLDEVLEHTRLSHLCVDDVFFPAPAPPAQSQSLQFLEARVNATFPQLCQSDLPHMEVLSLRGLVLHHEFELLGTLEDQLEALQPIIASLASGFPRVEAPLAMPEHGSCSTSLMWPAAHRDFWVSSGVGQRTGAFAFPIDDTMAPRLHEVLQLLAPLGPTLAGPGVRVCVEGMSADREALHLFARLFPCQEMLARGISLADCTEADAREIVPHLCFC